ncbi:hypothetical protein F2Q69_00007219 [Brassica cretica]|uniref:Uncharacterized protein n=1 Tax=Brassica cretica TaxID=69181 RepID=A0A8S9P375_BRACR|nr:hypothetical protein F2Q69_00007219 [Brassica cretica]
MESPRINVKFPKIIMKFEENGLFPQEDKDLGEKRKKVNRPKEEYIRNAMAEGAETQKTHPLDQFRHFSVFVIEMRSIRFTSLRWLELGNSLTALAAGALPVVIAHTQVQNKIFLLSFFIFINS